MTFAPTQWMDIVRRVYQNSDCGTLPDGEIYTTIITWEEFGGQKRMVPKRVPFRPSLTGTDRECKQALDCIVAADKLGGAFTEYGPNHNWPYGTWLRGFRCSITAAKESNILTAALHCLLEAK